VGHEFASEDANARGALGRCQAETAGFRTFDALPAGDEAGSRVLLGARQSAAIELRFRCRRA
jgi:hypothetical protein